MVVNGCFTIAGVRFRSRVPKGTNPEEYWIGLLPRRREYCAALGIRPFDEDFYSEKALIAEIPNHLTPGSPAMSLAKARELTLLI
jgi:hypothetical protein